MSDFIIPLGIDGENLLNGFRQAESGIESLESSAKKAQNTLNKTFSNGAKSAEKLDKTLKNAVPALENVRKKSNLVNKAMGNIGKTTKQALSDKHTTRFRKGFDKLKRTFKEFGIGFKAGVRDEIKKAGTDIEGVNAKAKKSRSVFGGLGKIIPAVFAVGAIVQFGRKIIDTISTFQKFEAVLTNTLGSNSQAKLAMNEIVDFASKTPFQVDELTDSFVKFANRGVILARTEMTKIGDIAASQGKSFDQLTEAILDAQTGEFERLKQFGIKAGKTGNTVRIAFGGITKSVNNNEKAIRDAILAIGEMEGVAGGMDKISKTIGGQLSNMQDKVTALFLAIGDGASGGIAEALFWINNLIETVTELITSGKFAEWIDPIVIGLTSLWGAVKRVIDRVVAFGQESEVGNKVREIFNKIPKVLGAIYEYIGLLIDAFVEFFTETAVGEGIVDAIVGTFNLLADGILFVMNALEDLPNVFIALKATAQQAIDNIRYNFENLGNSLDNIRLKAKRLFTFSQEGVKEINDQIAKNNQEKATNNDKKVNPLTAGKNAYAEAKKARAKELSDREKAREAERKANAVQGEVTGRQRKQQQQKQAQANQKAVAQAKKRAQQRIELEKKKNEQILKYTQALEDAILANMKEGQAKEIAQIELNFERQKETIKKDKALTKQAKQDQADLLIELEKTKQAKIAEIKEKHNAENLALELEAQKTLNDLREDGKEKILEGIEIDFKAQEDKIKEKYKDRADLEIALLFALGKEKERVTKKALYSNNLKEIEAQEKLTVSMLKAYNLEKLGVIEGLAEAEKSLATDNELNISAIEKSKELTILALKVKFAEDRLKLARETNKEESQIVLDAIEDVKKAKGEFKDKAGSIDLSGLFNFDSIGNGDLGGTLGNLLGDTNFFEKDGKKISIGEQLGLSPDEQEAIIGSFTSVFSTIKELYGEMIQDQIDKKDEQIEKLSEQIGDVEEAYNKEVELQKQGYANNAQAKKKELDQLKKLREKEQKEKEQLQKKKTALAKIEIAVQTAITTAQLIAAAAAVFKAHAGIPFAGVALGVAAAAALVAGFIAIKSQSDDLAGNTQSLGDGGWVEGKPHSQGGVKYRSKDPRAGVVELEGNEFVAKKRSAKKHPNLLEAINNDDFTSLDATDASLKQMLDELGITMPSETTNKAIKRANENNRQVTSGTAKVIFANSNSKSEKYLEAIAKSNGQLLDIEEGKEQITYSNGYKIVKRGNEVIKIKLNEV